MTTAPAHTILDDIYTSLQNDNEGLDPLILKLKIELYAKKQKSVEIDTSKIPQNNRQGRKLMQSYFKKRGVLVEFSGPESAE